jgi:hypothetical protein
MIRTLQLLALGALAFAICGTDSMRAHELGIGPGTETALPHSAMSDGLSSAQVNIATGICVGSRTVGACTDRTAGLDERHSVQLSDGLDDGTLTESSGLVLEELPKSEAQRCVWSGVVCSAFHSSMIPSAELFGSEPDSLVLLGMVLISIATAFRRRFGSPAREKA